MEVTDMAQLGTLQPSKTFRGTWDEILAHSDEIPKTSEVEVRVFEAGQKPQKTARKGKVSSESTPRVSAMGKYAGVLSSEEFMRRKQEEIALEDRPRR